MSHRISRTRLAYVALGALGSVLWWWLPAGISLDGVTPNTDAPTADHSLAADMEAVAGTFMAEHPPATLAWNWGEGVLIFGLHEAARAIGDATIDNYVSAYLRYHRDAGIEVDWSDDTTPAIVATIRMLEGETEHAPLVEQVKSYVMRAPRSEAHGMLLHLGSARLPLARSLLPEVWVDSLFHVAPMLVRYSVFTGDARYRNEALRQLVRFLAALQDPQTGLVTHAYNDLPRDERVPAFSARAFWARGNGWMLAALVDALSLTPPEHPLFAMLQTSAVRLAAALQGLQTRSGLFHTLLLDPTSYLETAGSALIIYGLAKGVRTGLLNAEEFPLLTHRGAMALRAALRRVGSRTVVTGTSLGTNPIEMFYAITPTADQVSYGVGAWLLAAAELSKTRG